MQMPKNKRNERDVGELIKRYYSQIKGFIRKRVNSDEDAEDLLQDVFYQLAKVYDLLDPIENVSAWLYRVARNEIIDRGRKKKSEESLYDRRVDSDECMFDDIAGIVFDEASTPETEYARMLIRQEFEYALAELPEEQRMIFELTELLGFSFKEISESMNISANTLISRKRYAILSLRKRLRGLYSELICQ